MVRLCFYPSRHRLQIENFYLKYRNEISISALFNMLFWILCYKRAIVTTKEEFHFLPLPLNIIEQCPIFILLHTALRIEVHNTYRR